MFPFERSEKPHLNVSPTVSFPTISTRGVVLFDAPWRYIVDNVRPKDHE